MFLPDVEVVYIEPCLVVASRVRARAEFPVAVDEVLPYLNTVLKNATYNHRGPNLTFIKDGRLITLYSRYMTVAKALNSNDVYEIADYVRDLLNKTWAEKENIVPSFEMKARPKPLEIYGYLPRTNCKACGEATCLAFATRLLLGEQRLKHCRPLQEEYSHLRAPLLELVASLGYEQE
ncbi:MAG: (Fe-S)-binding protein [Desulfurispora sp.]|uniref:(Fe-S)-binding protein n=1 Tax=Desulfurispora sp. TaxID=3014275 RepID=UPI004049866F